MEDTGATMSHSHEITTFVELTKHTLIVAQTKDERIDLFRECSLAERPVVEEALTAAEPLWKTQGVQAVAALSPVPAFWHCSTPAEASRYRSEEGLRELGSTLPHGLVGAFEITACHAADGTLITPDGHARWLLGLTSETSLALALANASEWKIESVRTESATLSHVGAITDELRGADHGSVILWDLAVDRSHLFLITPRGVQAIVPCTVGLDEILTGVQNTLKLRFRGAAVRLFYDHVHDFSETGSKIAAHVAPALRIACAGLPQSSGTPRLACTGLIGAQSWFVNEAALAAGLQPWSPKLSSLCAHLKLQFASPELEARLTPASVGLLHRVASHQKGKTRWHPDWSRAGVTRLPTAAPFFAPALASPAPAVEAVPTPPAPAPVAPSIAAPAPPPRVKPSLRSTRPPPVQAVKQPPPKVFVAPKMPEKTVARLRDEAYVQLCRQALTEALDNLEAEKRRVVETRPPFGVLGSKKARDAYENSLRLAQDTEINHRQQLKELEPIDHWVQSALQEQLHEYLDVSSVEYHGFSEACILVERWQNYVGELHEFAIGFARDARLTATLAESRVNSAALRSHHTVTSLRDIASHLHAQIVRIEMVSREVTALAGAGGTPVTLPSLPAFQHGTWVDRILLLNPSECARELKRQEEIARDFINGGKNELLLRAEAIRSTCLHARLDYLNKYWADLRVRVLQQYAGPKDVDKVIAGLKQSYVDADLQRRRESETNNPFALVR